MTAQTEDPNGYPEAWGYKPQRAGALEAAFDVYAASLSDEEWTEFVTRTREGGR